MHESHALGQVREFHAAVFAYDADGNRTSATDAAGNTTSYHYDVMDNLAGVTDALAGETRYAYDRNYNLSTVTNARGNTTTYAYTPNDLLERVTDPLGHLWSFAHDGAGNLAKTTYPDGTEVSRTYTQTNLLDTLAAGSDLRYAFHYLPDGRLAGVEDVASPFAYSYDAAGRLAEALDAADPAVEGGFAVRRAYDAAGHVSELAASGEGTRSYSFDLAGRLATITLPGQLAPTTFAYDAAGLLSRRFLADGSVTSWDYDAAGRLASIATTMPCGVLSFAYERDADGNVTKENATRYRYDALGRLASWYDPATDATTTYAYDAAYNLTQTAVDGSVTASFAFDGADRISSSGYGYDQRGNMTADPTHRYRYDALNRLTAVLDAASETTIAAYTYDFENRRTSAADASGTVYFHYDGASANVIAETDGAGATIASYAYDAAGRIHSMSRAGATYYYHTNAHGDVVAVTNATGEVANTYRYDPWGRVLEANETVPNPYRYASYRYDERAGLYYLWHRWYDAGTMRFMTKDVHPTQRARPVSMNSYVYCEGDPVNLVDPTGLSARAWVQYAADSLVFVLRVAAVFTLGLGVILGGNAGVIGAGVLLALLGRIVDAGADANWDAQRCGNRAVGNPDWAAYYMAKYFSGPLAPAVGAASDFLRGLLVDIPNSIDRLWEDADWLEEEW